MGGSGKQSVRFLKSCNTVYEMTGSHYEREMPPGVIGVAAFIFDRDTPGNDKILDIY